MATTTPTRRPPKRTPRDARPPTLPGPVKTATAAFFGGLSSLRRKRAFHPDGKAYEARFIVPGGDHGAPLFDVPGEHAALIRISRGVGLPQPIPDTIGLAIRILDAHGPNRHQDLLMNTSIDAPILHHLLLPAPLGPYGQSYSSSLPYRIGDKLKLVGALPRRPNFDIAIAPVGGRLTPVGELRLGERLPAETSERLKFNVWHTGGGIRPAGFLQALRDPAYRGSQQARAKYE